MVQALRRTWNAIFHGPYDETLRQIDELSSLDRGWNTYRAGRVLPEAQRRARDFVARLTDLPTRVPPPAVVPTPKGGVVLRWQTAQREVEIVFAADGGEYSVAAPGDADIIDAGSIHEVDLLKDVVREHVGR